MGWDDCVGAAGTVGSAWMRLGVGDSGAHGVWGAVGNAYVAAEGVIAAGPPPVPQIMFAVVEWRLFVKDGCAADMDGRANASAEPNPQFTPVFGKRFAGGCCTTMQLFVRCLSFVLGRFLEIVIIFHSGGVGIWRLYIEFNF